LAPEQFAQPNTTPDTTPDTAAAEMLRIQLMSGPWIAQSLYAAAELGLADHLGADHPSADHPSAEPVPVGKLAAETGTHADTLYRFCRALAGLGLFTEHPGRAFTLTPLGATLRSDRPGTLRYAMMMHGAEGYRAWAEVLHTLRTGQPAFDQVYGMPFFEYLDKNPAANEVFSRTMGVTDRPPAVLAECDFGDARHVVDIGGGTGSVLATVLGRAPLARGVLLDLPPVVADAPANLARYGVADRCEVVGGSFFGDIPAGGDTYLLSRVLHDWDDDRALRLLTAIHAAMAPDGRLVVIDHLLPATGGFHPGLFADLHMLVVLGGRDRTEAELRALLGRAGFAVTAVRSSAGAGDPRAQSCLEAVRRP
jgi:SAM-dependent methyltransferase